MGGYGHQDHELHSYPTLIHVPVADATCAHVLDLNSQTDQAMALCSL